MKKLLVALSLAVAALTVGACEPARRGIDPGVGPVSGPIALTTDDTRIVVAAEDHGAVLVVDRQTREVVHRIPVAAGPSHLIVDGDRAIVTSRYGHTVSVVDLEDASVTRTVTVGAEPMGLVSLGGERVAVAVAGDQAIAIVDLAEGRVEKTIHLDEKDPRAVALLEDGTLYVSHLSAGRLSRVDVDAGTARLVDVTTRNDFGARLTAEHLRSFTVDPNTGTVLMAHSQANQDTVRAPIGDPNIDDPIGDPGCGYSGCPAQLGAVVPGVTEVDPEEDVVIVPQSTNPQNGGGIADCFDCDFAAEPGFGVVAQAAPPSVLNPFDGRFAGIQLANPTVLALFDGGRGQLVVNMGTKNAVLLRRTLTGGAADVIGFVKLGSGAQGVAISHDGKNAYVWNQFDASISEIELPDLVADADTRFAEDAERADVVTTAELGIAPEFAADTFTVAEDAFDVDASIGRKMFHDATDSRISASGSISCASCHPDGRSDGRTWQFTFGPRNTPQLGGNILDTAPFHWPGDVPTVAALNDMTVLPFMGGSGLDAGSFQFIAAYLATIPKAPSPVDVRPRTALEQRGEEIFFSAETQCATCHAGEHFTDNVSWDIGTKSDDRDIRAFQTPVLHGLHRSAPYLHDGKYPDLRALVNGIVKNDQMGKGSHLSAEDIDALVAYLETL